MVIELDALPDWLTITTDNPRDTQFLRNVGQMFVGSCCNSRAWRFREYTGYRRHDTAGLGGCAWAVANAGEKGIIQAWGSLSQRVGHAVSRKELRATRVDLAVTVLHDHEQMSVHEMLPTLDPGAAQYSGIVPLNTEGGTLYVGHRSSERFGRLYDKGAQLGGDTPHRVLWRYEVELKRSQAEQAAQHIWYSHHPIKDMRTFVLTEVEHFFTQHGVPTPFNVLSNSQHSLLRYATRIRDDQKTIRWLTEQVRPCLFRMIENGHHDAIVDALGVGVRDQVPVFELTESVEAEQYLMWPQLDKMTETV